MYVVFSHDIIGNQAQNTVDFGSYMADRVGSVLYVIRGAVTWYKIIGHYDPASGRGYIEADGGNVVTEMEILVLV